MKFNLLVNWKLKAYFLAFMLMVSFGTIQAQTITVKGKVTGDGEALPGVSVLVKGTSNGTVTDFDGFYEIKAKANDVLLFSYIGFSAQQINIGGKTTINAVLKTDVAALDEVVVVGYGTQKKKELTGAVSQMKSDEIMKTATSDLSSALQGQIAGVTVVASDGAPGSEANIMIRGLTSINGGNKPLYVVDGIPFEGDPKLSTSEVERYTNLYGSYLNGNRILNRRLKKKTDSPMKIRSVKKKKPKPTKEEIPILSQKLLDLLNELPKEKATKTELKSKFENKQMFLHFADITDEVSLNSSKDINTSKENFNILFRDKIITVDQSMLEFALSYFEFEKKYRLEAKVLMNELLIRIAENHPRSTEYDIKNLFSEIINQKNYFNEKERLKKRVVWVKK